VAASKATWSQSVVRSTWWRRHRHDQPRLGANHADADGAGAATCSKRRDPLTPAAALRMARTNSVPGRVLEDVAARTACIASRANKAARMHPGQASSRRAPMTADPARTTYALIEWSTCATTRRKCAERFCCPRATTVWRRERFWQHDHRGCGRNRALPGCARARRSRSPAPRAGCPPVAVFSLATTSRGEAVGKFWPQMGHRLTPTDTHRRHVMACYAGNS
jgi:hypothetical protein